MSAAREVAANRGESTSPGLSSPPSPTSPTRQTATPTGHSHANATSLPPNSAYEGNGDGGVKSVKSIGAKNAIAPLRKPRNKRNNPESKPASSSSNNHNNNNNNHHHHHHHHQNNTKDTDIGSSSIDNIDNNNNNENASTATEDSKPKKTRAARGTSDHFKKKQQKQQHQHQQLEHHQQASRETSEALQVSRQLKITESLSLSPRSPLPPKNLGVSVPVPATQNQQQKQQQQQQQQQHYQHQNGNSEAIPKNQPHPQSQSQSQSQYHQNIPPTTRPASGQNYDPIRSSTVAPRQTSPLVTPPIPQKPHKIQSASSPPSIHSMIEQTNTPPNYSYPQPTKREDEPKTLSPPEPKRPRLSPPLPVTSQQPARSSPRDIASAPTGTTNSNTIIIMDIDTDKPSVPVNKATNNIKKPSPNASTTVSSSSHSPKPVRPKETQVAISSGSGLLSGSVFSGGIDNPGPEKSAPTVVLNVPLTGDNQYVNFTRLAEERYGFNALHPRLAAQRERLARVAAAGAALENANKNGGNLASGDEMSVDLSDGEADNSNVEMGGVNDGERIQKSGEDTGEAGAVKKPRKRLMKEDMYDKEDDFIDDTEMIWEEQAAASKDGFFVYSGPLVPPGQEPQIERCVAHSSCAWTMY